jgi:hypothetical protein
MCIIRLLLKLKYITFRKNILSVYTKNVVQIQYFKFDKSSLISHVKNLGGKHQTKCVR